MRELQIHDAFIAWLRKLDIPYVHHDPTRRSGIRAGWPDFSVFWMQHALMLEIKTRTGKLSLAQTTCIEHIKRSGNKVVIAYSLEMCIDACKDILLVGKTDFSGVSSEALGNRAGLVAVNENSRKTRFARTGKGQVGEKPIIPAAAREISDDASGKRESAPTGNLFIANILGNNWVCRGDPDPGGTVERVRRATAADLINTTLRA